MKAQIHFIGDQDTGEFRLEYTGNASTECDLLALMLALARSRGYEIPRSRFDREKWE